MADDALDLLREVRERFETAWDYDRDNRTEALDDLEFRAGNQWPTDIAQERKDAKRPCLTINHMGKFIRQVTGEIRQNRPSVKVRPVDDESDPKLAETYTGVIRHIEQASDAQAAYVTAAESAATCGMGAFRVVSEYSSDDTFDLDLRIRRIRNPFAVVWDPSAVEPTKEDARYCFVTKLMSQDAYKEAYPNAKPIDFDGGDDDNSKTLNTYWRDGNQIRVAEYWVKKPVKRFICLLRDGTTVEKDDSADKAKYPPEMIVREREVETHKVVQYIVSGAEILSGPTEWAGRFIPIVPVEGETVEVGERIVRHGLIRYAKDPQRLYNYWRTTAAESIALAPKQPFVGTTTQFKGREAQWRQANTSNVAFLAYNPDPSAPGAPQRSRPADPPAAMWQEAEIAENDMHGTTGIYPPSLGQKSNETSGIAIRARQSEGDVGSFVYSDNLARSIRHCGRILVDLIPKVYDTERVIRMLGEDGSEGFVKVNVPLGTGGYGSIAKMPGQMQPEVLGDFTAGKYDVEVITGPSYATRRLEASDSMFAFLQAFPDAAPLIGDLVAKTQDWPGSDEIAKRLRKQAVASGVAEPEPGEPQPAQPQAPPDPKLIEAQMRPQLEQMKAEMKRETDLIIAHIKAAAAIEVARINAGADMGAAAYAAEASAAGTMHATQVDADTRLKEAAMSNLTQAHTSGVSTAAQERIAAQKTANSPA